MKLLTTVLFFVLSINTYGSGFSSAGKITELYSNGSWVLVEVDNPNKKNPAECPRDDRYGIHLSNEADKNLYSMLLSAHAAQNIVSFWIAGCEGQSNEYPGIISVKMAR